MIQIALLRLALNVAATRVVLVNGHTGPDAAGQVIEAFGHFLIGCDSVVGLFVFMILIIINLVVIPTGPRRVSEVSARFTLAALPGKEMATYAAHNAGLLTPDEAQARRTALTTEAASYQSLYGAHNHGRCDTIDG